MNPRSMYINHFGLKEPPFSLTPDPRYLYMSERHREGLAHLLYGVQQPGGFIQLTGEIGCGKTTLCRCLVSQLPPETDIALILNPRLTVVELLAAVCDELRIQYPAETDSIKVLIDALNQHLLKAHASGRHTVLVIDEAQNLHRDVLEQIRLLTNLETEQEKLLQIILIGQPELLTVLKDPSLRQLAQRITARYHLRPLTRQETYAYIQHRLAIAGLSEPIFCKQAAKEAYRLTGGVPRLINILCDRAMLGAYTLDKRRISAAIVRRAGRETRETASGRRQLITAIAIVVIVLLLGAITVLINPWNITGRDQIYYETTVPNKDTDSQANSSGPPPATDSTSRASSTEPSVPLNQEFHNDVVSDSASGPISGQPAGNLLENTPQNEFINDPPLIGPGQDDRFKDIVSDPSLDSTLVASFNSLYDIWNIPAHITPSQMGCTAGRAYGFECIFMTGNWLKLRRLDLPVILGIQLPKEQKKYVTLIGLTGNTATLAIGNQNHSFPLQEVDRMWDGSFILIWKPPFSTIRLPEGMRGEEIVWVRQTLDAYEGKPPNASSSDFFDDNLKARIMDFQKTQMLIQDGRIGPETLIRMTIALNTPGIPMLSRFFLKGEKS